MSRQVEEGEEFFKASSGGEVMVRRTMRKRKVRTRGVMRNRVREEGVEDGEDEVGKKGPDRIGIPQEPGARKEKSLSVR